MINVYKHRQSSGRWFYITSNGYFSPTGKRDYKYALVLERNDDVVGFGNDINDFNVKIRRFPDEEFYIVTIIEEE